MTGRTRATSAVFGGALLLSLLLSALGIPLFEPTPIPPSEELDTTPLAVRLLDRLDEAELDGPLTQTVPLRSLDDLDAAGGSLVFDEPFDTAPGWVLEEGDAVEDGMLSVSCRRRTPGYSVVVPVEPRTVYRFVQRAEPLLERTVEVTAVETRDVATGPTPLTLDARQLREFQRQAIRVHRPRPRRIEDDLEVSTVSFRTTPETRSVVLVVTSDRHPDPSSAHGLRRRFDRLTLLRWSLSDAEELAWVAGRSAVERELGHGFEVYGQFPPLAEGHDENYAFVRGLYAPGRTSVRLPLEADARGSVLSFDYTLAEGSRGQARFEVSLDDRSGTHPVWSDLMGSDGASAWGWRHASVTLSEPVSADARLVLSTDSEPRTHPVFARPRIDRGEPVEGPRHVILIAVDTLRADRLSGYGYLRPTSPHLDDFFRDSIRFENAISQANWTCPSFASIFTGLSVSSHGVYGHNFETPLPGRFETLAERMHAAGFETSAIAYKIPLYDGGYEQGFDHALIIPRRETIAAESVSRALRWLSENQHRRAFLFLHFNDPHQPFMPPPPYDRRFSGAAAPAVELPWYVDNSLTTAPLRELAADLYDGSIRYLDDQIGLFLAALRERGLYDDALIAFVSDHGEELWEHGNFGHAGQHLYDELVHVPLAIKPPGRTFRPRVVHTQVRGFDLMPTLLDLAGVAVSDALDAESLRPLFYAEGPDRPAVTESSRSTISLRLDGHKYILTYGEQQAEELYDLANDPRETENLAEAQPERLRSMRLETLDFMLARRAGRFRLRAHSPEGTTGDGTVVFRDATLEVVRLADPLPATDGEHPYEPGTLQRLLESTAPAELIVLRHAEAQERARAMDPAQIEALRALGYLDGS